MLAPVPETVDSVIREYARRYSEHDVDGVTDLCISPFLAIRGGSPIHMPQRQAARDPFAAMIDAYRGGGAATRSPIEIHLHTPGGHCAFATGRWDALDNHRPGPPDTKTNY